jgi:beta-glucuronidase
MFGYCFTQLTDVFQEKNGIFTFDREPKFDLGRIRALHSRPAAIEAGPIHPALDPDE